MTYRIAIEKDYPEILTVWQSSVEATHHFLTSENIAEIKIQLQSALPKIKIILAIDETNKIVGFSAVSNGHLDMLFLDAKSIGKGIGSDFFNYMMKMYPFDSLEVNKDSPAALKFYVKKGFKVVKESPIDDAGRPFPILHMEKA